MQKIAEGVASYERLLKNTRKKKKTEHLRGVWKSSSMRLLAVLSLLFCVVVCVDQARAEMQAVKLCGREFLRAVVYTCGGSRWRRFFSEPDMGGLSSGEQNSLENLSIPGSNWSKRDINNILTNLCCQHNLQMSELVHTPVTDTHNSLLTVGVVAALRELVEEIEEVLSARANGAMGGGLAEWIGGLNGRSILPHLQQQVSQEEAWVVKEAEAEVGLWDLVMKLLHGTLEEEEAVGVWSDFPGWHLWER
ncbi:hypothetical protein CCH79_00009439 [Gambusia affinis]|uniref:Insulin-like domain-containing protein n=1 Tax=Gambusia affinis TaxID=33528 RepID=A0A315VE58_GAMAF|nr:hypothetical protein CCH79_00009439 [Gambusia affinis]